MQCFHERITCGERKTCRLQQNVVDRTRLIRCQVKILFTVCSKVSDNVLEAHAKQSKTEFSDGWENLGYEVCIAFVRRQSDEVPTREPSISCFFLSNADR